MLVPHICQRKAYVGTSEDKNKSKNKSKVRVNYPRLSPQRTRGEPGAPEADLSRGGGEIPRCYSARRRVTVNQSRSSLQLCSRRKPPLLARDSSMDGVNL